jgi:hypothetical protein
MWRFSVRSRAAKAGATAISTSLSTPIRTLRITVFDYVGLKEYIASLFDMPVDIVNQQGLKPFLRPSATADAIDAF